MGDGVTTLESTVEAYSGFTDEVAQRGEAVILIARELETAKDPEAREALKNIAGVVTRSIKTQADTGTLTALPSAKPRRGE